MDMPILTTKLFIPSPPSKLVRRFRLIHQLQAACERRLTIVSAPAGFGKTTLISEWIADSELSCAWLSLDEGDNDPVRFLTYLVSALQTIIPNIGEDLLPSFHSHPLATETMLTALINDICNYPHDFVLVLDDYHVIKNTANHHAVSFLLEKMPAQMHLVVTTREDPPLPIPRLRARNQLAELRLTDLRFSFTETAEFLNQIMSLNLTVDDIQVLENRTEGWIAGLQMAAISMEERKDNKPFIQTFSGNHRFIFDYLVEEILQNQPHSIRDFLFRTSVLDRLSSALCHAVTGMKDSQDMLEMLERKNMFILPMDEQRTWYRYHHLFAEVLRGRSMKEKADQVPIWHQRASRWFEDNGLWFDAIHHALAAEDYQRAAYLIELTWTSMRKTRQEATVLHWIKQLPEMLINDNPILCVAYAWALLDNNELAAAEYRLQDAERWLTMKGIAESQSDLNRDKKKFSSLFASIANARVYMAQAQNDVHGAINYAQQALDHLPEGDNYERGATITLLGLAYWTNGNLEEAHRAFAEGMTNLQLGGGTLVAIGAASILANIQKAQNHLREATRTYERTLQLAMKESESISPGTAELYMGLSEISLEQGEPEAARQYLEKGKSLNEQVSLPGNEYLWSMAEGRMEQAEGKLAGALDIHQAEQLYYRSPLPNLTPIAAMKARVWIEAGRLEEALDWVSERGLSVDDNLSYLNEYEHITLARLFIARYKSRHADTSIQDATSLLDRLCLAAEREKRTRSLIEIFILQAIALKLQGDHASALIPLERALTMAEPEVCVKLFTDEGTDMSDLLREALQKGICSHFVHKLLGKIHRSRIENPSTPQVMERLTERELHVLKLLATDLSGPEIACELAVSLNTMRTHTKSIYSKLEVNNRRAAVRRAKDLHLI